VIKARERERERCGREQAMKAMKELRMMVVAIERNSASVKRDRGINLVVGRYLVERLAREW